MDAWSCFKNTSVSVIYNIAPVKETRIKQRTEPWVTNEILQSISDRNKAFYVYKNIVILKIVKYLKCSEIIPRKGFLMLKNDFTKIGNFKRARYAF